MYMNINLLEKKIYKKGGGERALPHQIKVVK